MKERKSDLLHQFYMTLNASYQKCKENSDNLDGFEDIHSTIEALFKEEKTWINAYQIEQLLVPLYHDDKLDIELNRRIVDAQEELDENVFKYYESNAKDSSSKDKQDLLGRLIIDLQWQYKTIRVKQYYIKNVSIIASIVFVFTIILFFLPELWPWLKTYLGKTGSDNGRAYYLYTAMVAGAMGAVFSMLIALKGRLAVSHVEDFTIPRSIIEVLTKMVIGWGSGLIFFYFLQSGLLEGSFFPDFDHLKEASKALLNKEGQQAFALLIVWCFLSGFSEKLVPNMLSKTEKKTT